MPEETQTTQTTQESTTKVPDDLFQRVSKPQEAQTQEGDIKFDVNSIESIKDPQAKKYAQDAYKSFERGYQKKFQELAALRKEIETSKQPAEWTTERVQGLLNDPNFVKAAQSVAGVTNQQDNNYSALTDEEKKQIDDIQRQMIQLQKQNQQLLWRQQDSQLKDKYSDYNPEAVDTITADLLSGKRLATREDLWKVHQYDEHIKRAYQLGREDRKLDLEEKMTSLSAVGETITPSGEKIEPEEGESSQSFLKRILFKNAAASATRQAERK